MSVCRCFKLIVWVPNLKEGGWRRCAQSARHKVASLRGRPPSPQSLDAPASRASPAVVADSPAYRGQGGQGASHLGLRTATEKVHWRPGDGGMSCSAAEPRGRSQNSSVMSILLSPWSAPCRYAVVSKSGTVLHAAGPTCGPALCNAGSTGSARAGRSGWGGVVELWRRAPV